MIAIIEVTKSEEILCPGWKSFEECPNAGEFNKDSSACKECEEDMLNA